VSIQQETLELLEWERLCQHLATFAATKLGAVAARYLVVPAAQADSERLLAQTREAYYLETAATQGLSFEGIEDVGDALDRAELQGVLAPDELYRIATTLAGMRRLRRFLDGCENVPVLQELVAEIRTYPELEQEIYHCIDDNGEVADRASEKLAGIRVKIRQTREKIYGVLNSLLQRMGSALSQGTITQRGDRFVIPVKATHKERIPGVVHDSSGSGSTLFVEPNSIVNFGNHLRQYYRQEREEIEAICRMLTEKVAAVKEDLEKLLIVATTIDLAAARARYSLWIEGNPPQFVDRRTGQKIVLRQLRHPLLVWQQKYDQGFAVVPIDLQVLPQTRVVTITGPNTGGKTVTLKTLALAALMAKIGLFVPAREPVEIPWFDRILADIGDEQSLEQSLSTFSGHIRRIGRILAEIAELPENANGNVLILLDEVGAGTDPAEGSALAIALLRSLASSAQLTLASTHYGELKALKYQDERFENASVEFDEITLAPTYRLLWGIPGRSNALAIAKRLGLREDIVEFAQNRLDTQGSATEIDATIAGLEAQRRRQEEKANEAAKLLAQTESFYAEVSAKAIALKERERELKAAQEVELRQEFEAARGEIAKVIRRLQSGKPSARDAQDATDELKNLAGKHIPVVAAPPPPAGFNPQLGDRIRIPKLGQTAEVISPADTDGNLTVKFGLMKMNVTLAEIESLTGEQGILPKKTPKATAKPSSPPTPAPPPPLVRVDRNTIDVRGKRVTEAEMEIDRAIDGAYALGLLWIVHGKGTGKLREGIHAYLQTQPTISRFEIASDKDGGAGVTIAFLG
jgi:DNA mismatch repair protein MutS2